MAQALGYGHGGEAHLYEQRDVAVAQVVDADALDVRVLAAAVELVVELGLGEGEDAFVLPDGKRSHPLFELVGEELGHHDGSDGLGRLGRRHHVAPVQALVGLRHLELEAGEVEVWRRKGQELAKAQAAPVEHLEGVVALRLVGHRIGEAQILLARPEEHLAALGRAHARGLRAGVALEAVVAHGMVEDGGELVVHRAQIGWRVGLAPLVAVRHEAVLPAHHVDGFYLVHAHVAEVRQHLALDHVALGVPGMLAQARAHVGLVDLVEGGKGGVHRPSVSEENSSSQARASSSRLKPRLALCRELPL